MQGFLGHKNQNNIRSFQLVQPLKELNLKVAQVCAARNHSLVVSTLAALREAPPLNLFNVPSPTAAGGEVYSFGFPKHGAWCPDALLASRYLTFNCTLGRLGHGDDAYRRLPTRIEALKGKKVLHASCLGAHNAVLTDDRQIFMWGSGTVRLILFNTH